MKMHCQLNHTGSTGSGLRRARTGQRSGFLVKLCRWVGDWAQGWLLLMVRNAPSDQPYAQDGQSDMADTDSRYLQADAEFWVLLSGQSAIRSKQGWSQEDRAIISWPIPAARRV